MSNGIKHFLIVYDHEADKLVDVKEFGTDGAKALAAYSAKEKEYGDRPSRTEIVLIGSDSFETVKLTHGNYFEETIWGSKYLAGI